MFIVILFIFLGILSGVLCRKLSTGHASHSPMWLRDGRAESSLAHLAVALPVGH